MKRQLLWLLWLLLIPVLLICFSVYLGLSKRRRSSRLGQAQARPQRQELVAAGYAQDYSFAPHGDLDWITHSTTGDVGSGAWKIVSTKGAIRDVRQRELISRISCC